MKRHLAVVLVVLASCSGSAEDATTTTSDSGTPSTVIEGLPSEDLIILSEAFGPGDFMLTDPTVGLAELASYRSSLAISFDGTKDGTSHRWTSMSVAEHTRDPLADLLTMESEGDGQDAAPLFLLQHGATAYSRDEAGACVAKPASDPTFASLLQPASGLAAVLGGESAGHEAIGGVESDGYRFDERAIGLAGMATATGEVWVTTVGGFVVLYDVTIQGGTDLFDGSVEGTITSRYELSDVSSVDAIEVPDDCPAGLIDAPLLADAANLVDAPGVRMYETASPMAEILAFYEEKGPDYGWTPAGQPAVGETDAAIDYAVGNRLLTLIVSSTDPGSRVVIVANDDTSGGEDGGPAGEGEATVHITGGDQASVSWRFAPEFSRFGGFWTMTFEDPANPMPAGPFLTLILDPDQPSLSYSDGRITIVDTADACVLDLDRQDADGAAGTMTCTGVQAFGASGPVDLTVTFDVTS